MCDHDVHLPCHDMTVRDVRLCAWMVCRAYDRPLVRLCAWMVCRADDAYMRIVSLFDDMTVRLSMRLDGMPRV